MNNTSFMVNVGPIRWIFWMPQNKYYLW